MKKIKNLALLVRQISEYLKIFKRERDKMAKVAQAETLFLEKARELVPKLWERAQETENIRRIPEETMKELKEAGLITMLRPKQYGGFETNMRTYADVIVEISKGCASTGWILA